MLFPLPEYLFYFLLPFQLYRSCSHFLCDWFIKNSVVPKKGNAKECSNYHTIAFISHSSKVMPQILQARLQHYMNCELPDVQARSRKGRGTRDQIAHIHWSSKKQESCRINLLLLYWLCQRFWLCGSQQTVENSSRDGNTRPFYLPPEKSLCM